MFLFGSTTGSQAQEPTPGYGVGIPDVFLRKYLAFRAEQLASRTPHVLQVRPVYVRGLSRSFTSMAGELTIDLNSGVFRVSLNGLTPLQTYGVWLVDQWSAMTPSRCPMPCSGSPRLSRQGPRPSHRCRWRACFHPADRFRD